MRERRQCGIATRARNRERGRSRRIRQRPDPPERHRARGGRRAGARGVAGFRHYGAVDRCFSCRPAGHALLGRTTCIAPERHGCDVRADECIPFSALAEADLQPTTQRPSSLIQPVRQIGVGPDQSITMRIGTSGAYLRARGGRTRHCFGGAVTMCTCCTYSPHASTTDPAKRFRFSSSGVLHGVGYGPRTPSNRQWT